MTVEEIKARLADARAEMERQRLLIVGYETLLRAHGEITEPPAETKPKRRKRMPIDYLLPWLATKGQPQSVWEVKQYLLSEGFGSGRYYNDSGVMQSLRVNLSLGKLTCGGKIMKDRDVKTIELSDSDLIGLPGWLSE